jgi:tRNA modification GTPase
MMQTNDTICAIATAAGSGAIAVIRVSGTNSYSILEKIFFTKSKKKISDLKAHTIHFGNIESESKVIDEVLVSLFRAPRSYTGEDSVEISCHGSVFIQQQILQLLIKNGARLAQAGEFTLRAFLAGKLDLSQAEAVADLIASQSQAEHSLAMQQMKGGITNEIANLRHLLVHFISLVELELDFSEEDVEFADRKELLSLIEKVEKYLKTLIDSFTQGNAIKKGIAVAIVGKPNVGKSTLLNTLLNEERAIVSEIPGTTRDTLEDTMIIEGVTFRFIDTAGLRSTTDVIENLGIKRTHESIAKADIVILMSEMNEMQSALNEQINDIFKQNKKLILAINKIDIHNYKNYELKESSYFKVIYISAKKSENIDVLQHKLLELSQINQMNERNIIVSNARHFDALQNAYEAILRVREGLKTQISSDFLAQDIRQCLYYFGLITGEITTDEILGNIFSKFCIGK